MQGSKSYREVKIIIGYWENLQKISIDDIVVQSGEYSYKNKLIDKEIGLIDSIIIVSALSSKSKIWTKDQKLLSFLDKKLIFYS